MHVPFVLENIEQAADEYFCQLVAFTAVGFPTDAYGVFLSVYFQDGVADVCFDGMGADRTGHLAVHIGTVEVQCEIFCYLEQFPAGFLFSLITPQTLIELFLSFFSSYAAQFPSLVVEDFHYVVFVVASTETK